MRTIHETNAHQRIFRAEHIGINTLQIVAATVVIPITGSGGKMSLRHAVLLKCSEHLCRIIQCGFVYFLKLRQKLALGEFAKRKRFFVEFHHCSFFSSSFPSTFRPFSISTSATLPGSSTRSTT